MRFWRWLNRLTLIEWLVLLGVFLFLLLAVSVGVAEDDASGDRMLCMAQGGVPIMNANRTQMVDCAMHGTR